MSFSERDEFLVREIIEAIDFAKQFVQDMSREDFIADYKTQAAVAMMFQRFGECGGKLSDFAKQKSKVDWRLISGLRNRVSHDYSSLDADIIWSVVENDLDELRKRCAALLKMF